MLVWTNETLELRLLSITSSVGETVVLRSTVPYDQFCIVECRLILENKVVEGAEVSILLD